MIDNLDMYIKRDEIDTLSSLFIGANAENTMSFLYPNINILYNAVPDVPYETRIWIEEPEYLIHHGKVWFNNKASMPDVNYTDTESVTMPYKWNGYVVKKKILKCSDIRGTTDLVTLLGEHLNDRFLIVNLTGYSYAGAGQFQDIKNMITFYGDASGIAGISCSSSSEHVFTIEYAVVPST